MRAVILALLFSSAAAFGIACGSEGNAPPGPERADGAADDSGADGDDCAYPDVHNDPRCPAMYSAGYDCQPCSPVGLGCTYPGAGDGNGCFAAAGLSCEPADGGVVRGCASDGGEASVGYWVAVQ